jgi:hypothetical protein
VGLPSALIIENGKFNQAIARKPRGRGKYRHHVYHYLSRATVKQ